MESILLWKLEFEGDRKILESIEKDLKILEKYSLKGVYTKNYTKISYMLRVDLPKNYKEFMKKLKEKIEKGVDKLENFEYEVFAKC